MVYKLTTESFKTLTATFNILTDSFKKSTAEQNNRTDKFKKLTEKFEQATAQGQAHLQFAQSPPADQKLQKSLPFLPPAWIHSATLKHLIKRRLNKINPAANRVDRPASVN